MNRREIKYPAPEKEPADKGLPDKRASASRLTVLLGVRAGGTGVVGKQPSPTHGDGTKENYTRLKRREWKK